MSDTHFDQLRVRHQIKTVRRRATVLFGLFLLVLGYALLAVAPGTSSEWVLLRVFAGFALLFAGFAIAVMPLLSRLTGGDE